MTENIDTFTDKLSLSRPVTIPEYFWDQMEPWMQEEVLRLEGEHGLVFPTGSRYYDPELAQPGTDFDIVVPCVDLWQYEAERRMKSRGFCDAHSLSKPDVDNYRMVGLVTIWKKLAKQNLDVFMFWHAPLGVQFLKATEACRMLRGPVDKRKRVEIFRHFEAKVKRPNAAYCDDDDS